MTRIVCALMRLTGRLWIAVADEIDRAVTTYRTEVPDTVPEWCNEEVDLP